MQYTHEGTQGNNTADSPNPNLTDQAAHLLAGSRENKAAEGQDNCLL